MTLRTRIWLLGTLMSAAVAVFAPAAGATEPESFGIAKWQAETCTENGTGAAECTYKTHAKFYNQAAGHPNYGITDFTANYKELLGVKEPIGEVQHIRVDIPPGLSTDPFAVPYCPQKAFKEVKCPVASQTGTEEAEVFGEELGKGVDVKVTGTAYNLEPPAGMPLLEGVSLEAATIGLKEFVYIEGHVSWHKEPAVEARGIPTGDYHEYFEIKVAKKTPKTLLLRSRLIFNGRAYDTEEGGNKYTNPRLPFLTLPSECGVPQTSSLELVGSLEGKTISASRRSTIPWLKEEKPSPAEEAELPEGEVKGCKGEEWLGKPLTIPPFIGVEVPLTPATTQRDTPDGITVEVKIPQYSEPTSVDSSALKDSYVTLPEGLTLNPSVANGLQACSDTQFGKGAENPVACPAASQIGTIEVQTPLLPDGSLKGGIYVGEPLSTNPESGKEYRIFLNLESALYGVTVRLVGEVKANATTGRLESAVIENPQAPANNVILHFNTGPRAPLANPLSCGAATTTSSLVPFTGNPAATPSSAFTVDSDGKGGACASTFSLTQSTASSPASGGAQTSFTLNLQRGDGNEYVSKLSTTLPPGLVGKISSVSLCTEPQAAQGTCSSASQIGTAKVAVGAGTEPLELSGPVYLTSAYGGGPYGLSVVINAEKIGPFNYGVIVTRAAITINPYTAQVTVTSPVTTIVGGAPVRLKTLSVVVNRANFMVNPTNCGVLSVDTTLTSTLGATDPLSTPFQATGCGSLPFAPQFTVSSSANTSRSDGASLNVKIVYPKGIYANVKSVYTVLPEQLPSRLTTLQQACPEATFNADPTNPSGCPKGSRVGTATATTPLLPGKLTGPAIFVSHGGAKFPDLDLVLSGDGITSILVGNTDIKNGVTTSNFASVPDVPVSSFELELPRGPYSALAAPEGLCQKGLIMPTTITAQNGKVIKQDTRIVVSGCKLRIISHRIRGHRVILRVRVPSGGRVSGGGRYFKTVYRRNLKRAQTVTLVVGLDRAGLRKLSWIRHHQRWLRRHHRRRWLWLRVVAGFRPDVWGPLRTGSFLVAFK